MTDPWLTNWNRTRSTDHLPLRQMAVADHQPLPVLIYSILVQLDIVEHSFSIAACNSFLAPSLNNCSRNGFCSSFARSSSETTLFSGTGASFLFWRPRVRLPCFFQLKGCAFLYLFIHNFRI